MLDRELTEKELLAIVLGGIAVLMAVTAVVIVTTG
ncbi:hypothetical protein C497_11053 [Halalkalicoccus jeotgali B3]|uniref:Uncharacterized protein n=1 Tax=Halalkalicoccus jeotgali (strain DSM 18796 / CECT 7217 / JCM 14584 / KCTC 4019 / B3) TaxID=795797 RepID=D8J5K6_HALJB|nr:hypothetical protein HacjB3_11595 [Halalkalicoccus jeotgali B3]ELY36528.1 hypothetical protein C497_11053 [Halalkalicoccus jeotgali B3]